MVFAHELDCIGDNPGHGRRLAPDRDLKDRPEATVSRKVDCHRRMVGFGSEDSQNKLMGVVRLQYCPLGR